MSILKLQNVSKKYHNQWALDNVSLEIKKGDIYGLIGKNGAGKTTLLKVVTKLIKETSGHVQLFRSTNHTDYIEQLKRTGCVIETPVAYEQLTAKENLMYYCKLRGVVDYEDIDKTLALVGLSDTGKKKFKNFSLGMKQKLGIAIALISNPDLLILDEPINGLDPIAIVEFRELLLTLNQKHNITIIISSHILTELYHVATRFGIINDGKLIKEITKDELDEISRDVVHIDLDNANQAGAILSEEFDCRFKVVSSDKINIYDFKGDTADIVMRFSQENIRIQSIYTMGTDLETYFTKLVDNKIGNVEGEQDA